TGKGFKLLYDPEKDMLLTSPKPSREELPSYYQSEDYISHTDSRKTITDKLYQQVKRYMLAKKLKWIEKKFPEKGRLLDIGAGTGDFLLEAKNRGWKVNGIEPNPKARELAREKGVNIDANSGNFKS